MEKQFSQSKTKYDDVADEELVIRICAGQGQLFDVIIARYEKKLLRYVTRLMSGSDDVGDTVQETFIKAHKNLASFDVERSFSPWIYRIAHNQAMDMLKLRGKQREVSLEQALSDDSEVATSQHRQEIELSGVDEWFEKELQIELHERIHVAIRELPPEYGEIIHLRYIDGFSYSEIADILGRPTNTIGTQVARAKKRLQKILQEDK